MTGLATKLNPPVEFYPDFLTLEEAARWFQASENLGWTRGEINMYGKKVPVPHDEILFSDPGLTFNYRGASIEAEPWPDFLLEARGRIQTASGYKFDFAVGNRYRTGKDSIGWHADDLAQLGERPAIASLSLGSTRKFKLRHKDSGETVDYQLESGTLLIMLPGCQENWLHAVPKTARPVGERINWTFRPHVDAAR